MNCLLWGSGVCETLKKKTICEIIDLRGFVWNALKWREAILLRQRGWKTGDEARDDRELQHSCAGRKGSAFLREEVPVSFSTFVFQKRNKLNVTKCHWFGISVLINKPRRRSWGIVGGNIWTNQRQTELPKVTCVYVSLRLCRHMKTTFLFLGCLLSRRLWQGWTDSLDKDTSAPETKHCGWSVNNEPWRAEAAYSLVLLSQENIKILCCFICFQF